MKKLNAPTFPKYLHTPQTKSIFTKNLIYVHHIHFFFFFLSFPSPSKRADIFLIKSVGKNDSTDGAVFQWADSYSTPSNTSFFNEFGVVDVGSNGIKIKMAGENYDNLWNSDMQIKGVSVVNISFED